MTDSTFDTRRRRLLRAVATPTGVVTVLIAVTFMFLVIAGPTLWGGPAAKDNVDQIFLGASWHHPFGTDNIGRDLFARTLVATRLSLKLALEATALGATLGITLGTLTGLMGRRANRALATLINLALAFPGLLIAIFLAIIFGAGARGAVLALAGAYAPYFARLAQTLTASVTGKEYLAAARILGVRTHRILLRHVLPNIAEPIIVTVTVAAGGTLLAFAGLSFLGLGVQIPAYDWGLLLNQGLDRIDTAPMATVGPGVAIVMAGIGFQLLGDLISRAVSAPATVRRSSGPTPTTAPTSLRDDTDGAVVVAEQLTVSFGGSHGGTTPVRGVSLVVSPGQMLGIVGESGSGKTLLAMALAGLLPAGASVSAERLEFLGNDLLRRPTAATQRVLGTRLGLVFQNPAAALNPSMKVARQLTEGAMFHSALSRRAATERAVSTLRAVAIPAPERRMRQYPHELSGGMKQRAVIAMSLMGSPALIIADEPTTALDVTVQGQILDLLRGINVDTGAASVLISHDIAVVASVCDRVVVMYGGTVVEDAPVDVALRRPAHPYTHALLSAVPGMDTARDQPLTTIAGRPPDPVEFPSGCPFSPRCPLADDECRRELPVLTELSVGHRVACRHPLTADPTDVRLRTVGTP